MDCLRILRTVHVVFAGQGRFWEEFLHTVANYVCVSYEFGRELVTTKTIHQAKLGAKPPVTVKGTKHGLLFMLDEHCEFESLQSGVSELLNGDRSGLFSGAQVGVFVDYGSRVLTGEENRILLDLFMQQDNFVIREWSSRTSARKALFANGQQKPADHSLFRGTIRAGQDLQFEGDVIVIGDVNPSGQLSATGDIYVFGRLYGIAHAGSQGNSKAVIAATDFAPMQLRIADFVGCAPEEDGKPLRTLMEFAYVKNEGLAVDKLKFLSSYLQERELER